MRVLIAAGGTGAASVPIDSYASFKARVQKVNGSVIRSTGVVHRETLPDGMQALALTFDSKQLTPGEYILVLTGVDQSGMPEDIGGYSFRVR